MTSFGNDPELVATFRAEAHDRLEALSEGLLHVPDGDHRAAASHWGALFRDAHTVKGSARMLGLDATVALAHEVEDTLSALRENRLAWSREVQDDLLERVASVVASLSGSVLAPDPEPEPAVFAEAITSVPATVAAPRAAVEHGSSLRVAAGKVGGLIDAVGEAELGARHLEQIIDRTAGVARETAQLTAELERALDGLPVPPEGRAALANLRAAGDELARDASSAGELAEDHRSRVAGVRDGTLALAMVPLRQLVGGFPTLVHRLATAEGADVRLLLDGADVELDKRVLDGVSEALTHLVTNAVDHGCETPVQRRAAGKPEQATVRVSARSSGSTVVLEVADDGRGVDEAAVRAEAVARGLSVTGDVTGLLFTPSFSTRTEVTESSGRGVGLDAVRHAVEGLGGTVELASTPGRGTTVTLTVPVSLGVLHCLLARAGGERYAIPVTSVVETIGLRDSDIADVAGTPVVLRDGGTMPVRSLADSLGASGSIIGSRSGLVVRHGDRLVVWAVDRLEGEQEVVVKDLGPFIAAAGGIPGITGATLDGDGSVVCLLDLREIGDGADRGRAAVPTQRAEDAVALAPARVLVVEDSLGVRELERVVLTGAGYDVTTCVDGTEGAAELAGDPYDAVVSDVEMPGIDGVELTRRIRVTAGWEQVPVVLLTSRGAPEDVRAGLDAGANAYLLKSDFNQAELVATVRRLIGR